MWAYLWSFAARKEDKHMCQDVTSIAIVAVILLLRIASCSIAEVLDVTLDPRQRKSLLSVNAIIASLALANWFVGSVMHNEAMRLAITAATALRVRRVPSHLCPVSLHYGREQKADARGVGIGNEQCLAICQRVLLSSYLLLCKRQPPTLWAPWTCRARSCSPVHLANRIYRHTRVQEKAPARRSAPHIRCAHNNLLSYS